MAGQITDTCNQVRDNLRVHVIRLIVRCGTLYGHFFDLKFFYLKRRVMAKITVETRRSCIYISGYFSCQTRSYNKLFR